MKQVISKKQFFIIVFIGFSITKLYVMPAVLAGFSKENLWFPTLLNFIWDLIFTLIIFSFISDTEHDYLTLLNSTFGTQTSKVIMLLYVIFFLFKAYVPIFEQKNSIELTFYETQPSLLTFMPFFIISFYIIIKGIYSYARSMEFLLSVSIIGFIIIFILSVSEGKYEYLLPVFSKPFSTTLYTEYNTLLWFGDSTYILFLLSYVKKPSEYKKTVCISYILCGIFTIIFLVVFYAIFGSIAERQYYALLKMSKYSLTLSNAGRFDYLATFLLALVSIFQTALPLILGSQLLNGVFDFKNKFLSPTILILLEITFSIITENDFFRSLNFIQTYITPFFIFMSYLIPFIVFVSQKRSVSYESI